MSDELMSEFLALTVTKKLFQLNSLSSIKMNVPCYANCFFVAEQQTLGLTKVQVVGSSLLDEWHIYLKL